MIGNSPAKKTKHHVDAPKRFRADVGANVGLRPSLVSRAFFIGNNTTCYEAELGALRFEYTYLEDSKNVSNNITQGVSHE